MMGRSTLPASILPGRPSRISPSETADAGCPPATEQTTDKPLETIEGPEKHAVGLGDGEEVADVESIDHTESYEPALTTFGEATRDSGLAGRDGHIPPHQWLPKELTKDDTSKNDPVTNDIEQETLRREYLRDRPWIVNWAELDRERFEHRFGDDDGRHIIEVLTETRREWEERAPVLPKPKEKPDVPIQDQTTRPNPSQIEKIRIQSPAVVSHIFGSLPLPRSEDTNPMRMHTFTRPFALLMAIQPKMKRKLEWLEEKWAQIPSDVEIYNSEKGSEHDFDNNRTALDHMRCYINFIEKQVLPIRDSLRRVPIWLEVRFNDLALLYPPGQLIVRRGNDHLLWRIIRSERTYDSLNLDGMRRGMQDRFVVDCYYIDHDGRSYGMVLDTMTFEFFPGSKGIFDLQAFPAFCWRNGEENLKKFEEQGSKFRSFVEGKTQLYYNGWTIPRRQKQGGDETKPFARTPQHVESSVIVAFEEAFNRHPEWKPHFQSSPILDRDPKFTTDHQNVVTHWTDKSASKELYRCNDRCMQNDFGLILWADKFKNTQHLWRLWPGPGSGQLEVLGPDIKLLPNRLVAYVLRDRMFAVLNIRSLSKPERYDDTFRDLKINTNHRSIVLSLVKAHLERREMQKQLPELRFGQDLVYGKGAGLFILLHGAPGVGKTATAEAVAQWFDKPLFPITSGQLGLTPQAVENELREIFRLAQLWDCVLLLDEADVFLARRDLLNLKRNALVSVFLRVLEYYSGILFLTTNRVGTIDEAFKSRIHLSLYYERLDEKKTLEIFQVNLRKIRESDENKQRRIQGENKGVELAIQDDEIMKFAKKHYRTTPRHLRWNGRQIRNAFQIASSMARYDMGSEAVTRKAGPEEDGESSGELPILGRSHFKRVAQVIQHFERYCVLTKGETDADTALLDGARHDTLRAVDLNEEQDEEWGGMPESSRSKGKTRKKKKGVTEKSRRTRTPEPDSSREGKRRGEAKERDVKSGKNKGKSAREEFFYAENGRENRERSADGRRTLKSGSRKSGGMLQSGSSSKKKGRRGSSYRDSSGSEESDDEGRRRGESGGSDEGVDSGDSSESELEETGSSSEDDYC